MAVPKNYSEIVHGAVVKLQEGDLLFKLLTVGFETAEIKHNISVMIVARGKTDNKPKIFSTQQKRNEKTRINSTTD